MLLQEIYKRAIETVLKNKKEEIKNRIDLINRGEVPEGYKKVHGYIIPKDWQESPLIDMCTKRQEKAGCKKLETLSISAGIGFVNQAEKFGRELSGEQYKNYTVIRTGDFSYNKENSKKYPQGCIYLLKDREIAAVPNVFNTFRLYDFYNNEYYMFLFSSGYLNKQLFKWINFGVRNDGLLNLYDEDFYKSILPIPSQQEQEKIVKILNCCDKVIELKEKLICEEIKKNINCSRKVLKKLKGDTVEIGEILDYEQPTKYIVKNQYKNKQNEEDIPVLTANKAFIKSYTNEKFGIYDNLPVIIFDDFTVENKYVTFPFKVQSSAMKILKPKNPNINLLFVYKSMQLLKFKANDHKRYYLSEYQYMPINLPDIETQNRTVEILSKIDRKIELLQQELEQYKQLKKSLSQLLLTGIVRTVEVDCEN